MGLGAAPEYGPGVQALLQSLEVRASDPRGCWVVLDAGQAGLVVPAVVENSAGASHEFLRAWTSTVLDLAAAGQLVHVDGAQVLMPVFGGGGDRWRSRAGQRGWRLWVTAAGRQQIEGRLHERP